MATITYNWASAASPFFVNKLDTAGNQSDPAIAALQNGSFLTTWSASADAYVQGRLISPTGTLLGTESGINSTSVNQQFDTSVAGLTNGTAIATFTDLSTNMDGDIRGRIIGSDGAPIGADFLIGSGKSQSDVAALTGGGAVVTFSDPSFIDGDLDIFAQRLDQNGAKIGSAVRVSAFDTNGNIRSEHSSVAGLKDGGFVVVWQESPSAGGDTEVYFRRYGANGTALDASPVLIDTTGSINKDIQVTALQDGGFAVAYADNGWGLSGTEITALTFNANGSSHSGFLRLNSSTTGDQDRPSITTMSNGFIDVSWSDSNGAQTHQTFDAAGNMISINSGMSSLVIEGEITALGGGLVADVRSSTVADGSGDSIRASIHELTRTTLGNGTSETLSGDSIRDVMTGGGGDDKFVIGLNGGTDRITDFVAGGTDDRVDLTAYTGLHSFQQVMGLSTQVGADTVLQLGPNSSLTLEGVQKASLRPGDFLLANPAAVQNDFNGDGRHDILLQNSGTGNCYVWELNGKSLVEHGSVGWSPGPAWTAQGTGDFNGDGKSGVLLQNSATGDCFVWDLNGTTLVSSGAVGWTPGADWHAKGTGDFNGDGRSDVLLQNAGTGDCFIWELNGTNLVDSGAVGWTPGPSWQAKATGDFNGDGKSDILLQNDGTGDCFIWMMDGKNLIGSGAVGWTPGADWKAKDTGDFNGDGRSDILLQNSGNGDCYIWELDGTNLVGAGGVGWTPGSSWQAKGTGDFNGDGKSDIVLQNGATGDCYVWELDGTNLVDSGPVGWTPGADWAVHM